MRVTLCARRNKGGVACATNHVHSLQQRYPRLESTSTAQYHSPNVSVRKSQVGRQPATPFVRLLSRALYRAYMKGANLYPNKQSLFPGMTAASLPRTPLRDKRIVAHRRHLCRIRPYHLLPVDRRNQLTAVMVTVTWSVTCTPRKRQHNIQVGAVASGCYSRDDRPIVTMAMEKKTIAFLRGVPLRLRYITSELVFSVALLHHKKKKKSVRR